MIGIAVWGLGRHALKNVLPAIERFRGLELVGVCSRNANNRRIATERWGGSSWESPAAMLNSPTVDMVYVATPTGLHFSQSMEVLRAEKHLICEKSLTTNAEDSRSLIEFARTKDLVLCEALMFEYHPQFHTVASLVRHADFGRPVHGFCCFGLPPLEKAGFRANKDLGGGALLDVGCYPVAMARALLGDFSEALCARLSFSGEVDESGDASLLFGDTRVDLAWGYNRAYSAEVLIFGERQSVYAQRVFSKDPASESEVIVRDSNGRAAITSIPAADAFVEMFKVVLDAVDSPEIRARLRARAASQASVIEAIVQCAM